MLGGRKALVVEESATTFYPYVEAVYTSPLFGERFAMTIQTVYTSTLNGVSAKHAALMQATKLTPGATRNPPVTIDICAQPQTSEGSLYDNPYVEEEGTAVFLYCFLSAHVFNMHFD